MKWLAIFLFSISGWADESHHHHHGDVPANAEVQLNGDSVYNLNSDWIDQENRTLKLSVFRGHPTVVVMLYTACKSACPVLIADVQKIENDLPADKASETRFLVVSLDPERDTSAQMLKFAHEHKLDLKRWSLFHGQRSEIRQLANILGVQYKQDTSGEISHSNLVTLLNKEGVIVYRQAGLGADNHETVKVLKGL